MSLRGPASFRPSFALHDDDDQVTTIAASSDATGASVSLSRVPVATVLRVRVDTAVSGFWWDVANRVATGAVVVSVVG